MWPPRAGTNSCTSAVLIDAEVDAALGAARARSSGVSKRTMPAPLPPMFAFTTTGKRSPSAAAGACDGWLMTRAAGYGRPSDFEQRQLPRLRGLDRGTPCSPLTTRHAEPLEVGEVAERVEDAVAAAAQVRRRAHAVEDQRVRLPSPFGRVVAVARRRRGGRTACRAGRARRTAAGTSRGARGRCRWAVRSSSWLPFFDIQRGRTNEKARKAESLPGLNCENLFVRGFMRARSTRTQRGCRRPGLRSNNTRRSGPRTRCSGYSTRVGGLSRIGPCG